MDPMTKTLIIIICCLGAVGIIAIIVHYSVEAKKEKRRLMENVDKSIEKFIVAARKCNLIIDPLNFSSATDEECNAWLRSTVIKVRQFITEKENEFSTQHNLTSECLYTESNDLGICSVSDDRFFYQIILNKEHFLNVLSPVVSFRYIETQWDNFVCCSYYIVSDSGSMKPYDCYFYFQRLASFVEAAAHIQYQSILLDDIIHYRVEGNVSHVSNVTGYGGGVNLNGAIAGGLTFGATGAIIGSQIGTETNISTKFVKKDNRTIVFSYTNDGNICTDTIASNDPETTINVLRTIIPQKERSVSTVSHIRTPVDTQEKKVEKQNNNLSQIKELKELLDIGAITQEEFDLKKKELLGL